MRRDLPYPKSFPTPQEAAFLKMAAASDDRFPELWRAWKDTTDWQEIDYATARLLSYFYPRLQALGIKDELTERVKGVHKATWVRNQLYLRAAREVAEICHAEGIPVLLLKGIPLISEVYKDSGARPLGDADILVQPKDGKRLTELLTSRGWRFAKEWAPERHNPSPSVYRVIKATELRNERGVELDVHYNIFAADHGKSSLDVFLLRDLPSLAFPERFWRHALPMELDGVPCLRLSNEDTLIHLIVHGSEGNTYRTFRWVLDSLLLIRRQPIDWDLALTHARDFGFALDLRIACAYLREEFDAPIPDSFIDQLSAVPLEAGEVARYYRVANIEHVRRFRGLGNIPLLWYAYWKFEPPGALKPFGFHRYVLGSWGLSSIFQVPRFALMHYQRKLKDRDPEFLRKVQGVGRDSLYIVLGKALGFLASFAAIAVMARFVPKEVIGSYTYVMAALAIVSVTTLPGMNEALMRAVGRGHASSVHAMMRQRLSYGLIGSVLAVLIGAATWLMGSAELGLAFLVAAPFVPLTDTFSSLAISFWQGKKRFGRSALIGAAYHAALALLSIPIFILSDDLVTMVLGVLGAQALIGYGIYRTVGKSGDEPDRESIALGMHLTAMQACAIVANNLDRVIAWVLLGPVTLAAYVLAATPVSKAFQMLPIGIIALPTLSGQKYTRQVRHMVLRNTLLLFLLTVPGTLLLVFLAPALYQVLFPLFPESVPYFQLLILGLMFSPAILLRSALVAFKETRSLYALEIGMPIVRIVLIAVLASMAGIYGLIIGTLLSTVLGAAATLLLFLRTRTID